MNETFKSTYESLESVGESLHAIVEVFQPAISLSRDANVSLPLADVEVGVKDMIAVAGYRRGNGNPLDMKNAPLETRSAPVIDSLLSAGAKIVASTSLLEYAAGAQHPDIPETRNPLNPKLTAGGSSAGSAALVGAGALPLTVGTDTGGSIRIPAAYCGVAGFKPTSGLIPLEGITPLAPTLDHCGFIAISIDYIEKALIASVREPLQRREIASPIRLGVPNYLIDDPRNDSRIITRFKEIEELLSNNGYQIVAVDGELLEKFRSAFIDIVLYEAWQIYGAQTKNNPDHFGAETLRLFLLGESVTQASYEEKMAVRAAALTELNSYMDGIDALMMPSVPYFAPETTPPIDSELGGYESLYTEVFNVSGQPAISIPASCDPMPMGLQLVGSLNDDLTLLEIARRIAPLVK